MEKEVYQAKLPIIFKVFLAGFDYPRRFSVENSEEFDLETYKRCEAVEQVWIHVILASFSDNKFFYV